MTRRACARHFARAALVAGAAAGGLAAAGLASARPVAAQHPAGPADGAAAGSPPAAPAGIRLGAQGIGLVTHAQPTPGGGALTEAYLTQPMLAVLARAAGGRLTFDGVLNLEGATLGRGELNAGVWGEGYVDRRHPHTWLHEAMATVHGRVRGVDASLAGGRGFVPFGTDDPMVRPFVKYPANHHLAQILERWVLIAAARGGPLIIEAALLSGAEPTGPRDAGGLGRFGDSWSLRATLVPAAGVELQASRAFLASPEVALGFGLDHAKSSASLRWQGALAGRSTAYLLAEWAVTRERDGGREAYRFRTALAEAALRPGDATLALRLERTSRPEEERGFDPFRTPPQHVGPIVGITEWTIASARIALARRRSGVLVEPFVEGAALRVRETAGSIFEPEAFYGSARHWHVSAGVRLALGHGHVRMGRYGAAFVPAPAHQPHAAGRNAAPNAAAGHAAGPSAADPAS